jgi:hypothetical protein
VGLFSSVEKREALAAEANRVRQPYDKDKAHKKSQHAASVRQQFDACSRSAMHDLLSKAALLAIDTSFFPNKITGDPSVKIVVMVLNEMATTKKEGGGVAAEHLRVKAPTLFLVYSRSGSEWMTRVRSFSVIGLVEVPFVLLCFMWPWSMDDFRKNRTMQADDGQT